MLNTDSVLLKGNESFEEAYAAIPERDSAKITDLYYLDKGEYKPAGSYTLSLDGGTDLVFSSSIQRRPVW